MKIAIQPRKLVGTIDVPASKSQTHRMLIADYLSEGTPQLCLSAPMSKDIEATKNGLEYICKRIDRAIDCKESGSTLRFLIPISLLSGGGRFTGAKRLLERPQEAYISTLEDNGIICRQEKNYILFSGSLKSGEYTLPGNISSQFITGLLFALPLIKNEEEKGSWIKLTSELESKGYVDMTLEVLTMFGIHVERKENQFYIPSNQTYKRPENLSLEGDYSQGAFFIIANAIGNHVTCNGLNEGSLQGDREVVSIVKNLEKGGDRVVIDMRQVPDIVPPVSVLAALRPGETCLTGLSRLRLKESDRIESVSQTLRTLGADVRVEGDDMIFKGVQTFKGGKVSSWNDHRIAMMVAIASTRSVGKIEIDDGSCVEKSYPKFWDDFKNLGGEVS